jgi:hypothetical protein
MKDVRFKECEPCSKKPGSPVLCPSCLHNRQLIEEYQKLLRLLEKELV